MDAPERYGTYLLYEEIGKGGMATVYRAEQQNKKGVRKVALKRLLPTLERAQVQLFLDEARLNRYLDHPNIATTFDSGRVFGTYFIAMEYVQGTTLKSLVEHCASSVGVVPQPITLHLAAQLLDALDHAHTRCDEQGNPLHIIHRDVTPANIILSETGVLKLIDFGLAKASLTTEKTRVGVIKGKYGYVAPEYMRSQMDDGDGGFDHRVDLWAVGIIMYELLTSRRLFDGPDAFETVRRVLELPIPRPSLANPTVSPELDAIVMTALERDPDKRWASAAAMRDRIRAVIAQPGNAIDHHGVAEWVRWALDQPRGRAPQLTPMMPVPIASVLGRDAVPPPPPRREPTAGFRPEPTSEPTSEPIIEPELEELVDPMAAVALPPHPPLPWTLPPHVWLACAGALVVIVLVWLVWKIVG